MLTIPLAKCSPSSVYSACVGIGNTLVAFKTNQYALLSNEFPNEVRQKAFLKWTSIDLSSKHMGVMLSKML